MATTKLPRPAQQLVIARIIAGDTNSEIRAALHDAGYPSDLVDSAFSPYRARKEVIDAIRRKDEEAVQSGFSQRSERILALAASAKRLRRLLSDKDSPLEFNARLKPRDLAALHREYRETMAALGALVDPLKIQTHAHMDMRKLTDEQIDRLSRGVPIEIVLATPSES